MTVHVIHRAGEAVVEPVAQTIEPVGAGRRGNAGQLEAQRAGLLFQAIFQGSHASILKRARPARSASKGSLNCRRTISAISLNTTTARTWERSNRRYPFRVEEKELMRRAWRRRTSVTKTQGTSECAR
jgi:hypothetical protein